MVSWEAYEDNDDKVVVPRVSMEEEEEEEENRRVGEECGWWGSDDERTVEVQLELEHVDSHDRTFMVLLISIS